MRVPTIDFPWHSAFSIRVQMVADSEIGLWPLTGVELSRSAAVAA